MIKVAIVGNIASGKSTVENIIESKGFKVFDTDKIAHEILKNSLEVKNEFGTTDRNSLAQIVFADSTKLQKLESIIHPKVKDELVKIFSTNERAIFVSVPQLFEAGFENLFDKIIYVTADEKTRQERLIKRNSYTIEEARKRISAQSENGKREKCDFVIENNGTLQDLENSINTCLKALLL